MKIKFIYHILTYIFTGTIFLSCFVAFFGDFGHDYHLLKLERKNPKKEMFPRFKRLRRAPKKFDDYFDYHFPFKKFYLLFGNSIMYYFLNISTARNVVIGKNNWLFNGDDYVDIAKGKLLFSNDQLESLKNMFLKREKYFKDNNIDYILFFATDKETIYPNEYMTKHQPLAKYTRYDQLYDYLKRNTSINVIYPKEHLREFCKKSSLPCYFKLDSHWNDIGAFYAYQSIYNSLVKKYPKLIAPTLDDFNIHYASGNKGFIGVLGIYEFSNLDIQAPYLFYKNNENINYLDDIRTSIEFEQKSIVKISKYTNLNSNTENLIPRIVIWGDSFSVRLTKYFVYNARETINIRHEDTSLNRNMIKNYNPTIVIDEFLTRKISRLPVVLEKRKNN